MSNETSIKVVTPGEKRGALMEMSESISKQSEEMVELHLRFAEIDVTDKGPSDELIEECKGNLKEAKRRFVIMQSGHFSKSNCPSGVLHAVDMLKAKVKAAGNLSGQAALNVGFQIVMPAADTLPPEFDIVEED